MENGQSHTIGDNDDGGGGVDDHGHGERGSDVHTYIDYLVSSQMSDLGGLGMLLR